MHSIQRYSSLGIALLASVGMTGLASAQAIIITNTTPPNHQIPLRAGSSVQIDEAGNLLAECALNTSGVCTQLSSGAGGGGLEGAPTLTFARSDTDPEVQTGEGISLTWTSTLATVCSAASTGPATSFSGPRLGSGSESISFNATGDYTFSLTCFNTSGGSPVRTVAVSVTQAPVNTAGCNITSSSAWFQPTTLTRVTKTFVQAFSPPDGDPTASYPNSVGFPVPIGANKGSYLTVPFVAQPNTVVDMTWDTAQANGFQGYSSPRPADAMFVGISPCPGDLRPTDHFSEDIFLRNGCRRVTGLDSMFYSTTSGTVNPYSICKLEAGKTYYINIAPVNPNQSSGPNSTYTCSTTAPNSANGCDVQIRHTGGFTN